MNISGILRFYKQKKPDKKMSQTEKNKNTNSSDKLLILQRQLFVITLTLLLCIIAFQICSYFADVLRILGISILFSYLFIAVVDWLNKFLKARVVAVLIVYAIVLTGIVFSAITLVPTVIAQISQLVNKIYLELPQLVHDFVQSTLPLAERLRAVHIEIKTSDLLADTLSFLPKIEAGQVFDRVGDVAVSTISCTVYGLSILLLSFYFLLDGYKMQASIIKIFPLRYQSHLELISKEIDHSLQSFLKGQVVLALGFGIAITIVFYAIGVHYALLLGIILAVWEIIPVIGPTIGFIPTVLSVAFDGIDHIPGDRFSEVIVVFAIFASMQWLKDNVVAPKYMGNVIGLHPVVIFLAIFIGAKIDGWLGIIFALPVACVVQVLAKHIHTIYLDAALPNTIE
jgi:predicted PurR-regulated permease PerM